MGYVVGMPSLKLNNVGNKSKHCGSFSAVALEALEERKGRDADINRELSHLNVYEGFRSARELMAYSEKHVSELSEKQVSEGGRKVRADAVVMCTTIIKPPAEMMAQLTRDEQIRFLRDAERLFDDIVGKDNCKSSVIHFDEQGAHLHKFWEPITADGRLCAKEMHNLKFFGRLNKEMPAHLRACGWDIEDCKAYDQAEELQKTAEQRAEERRKRGRSSAQFKAEAERERKAIVKEVDELKTYLEAHKSVSVARYEVDGIKSTIEDKKQFWGNSDRVEMPRDKCERLVALAERCTVAELEVDRLKRENRTLRAENYRLNKRLDELIREKQELERKVDRYERERALADRIYNRHKTVWDMLRDWITRKPNYEQEFLQDMSCKFNMYFEDLSDFNDWYNDELERIEGEMSALKNKAAERPHSKSMQMER